MFLHALPKVSSWAWKKDEKWSWVLLGWYGLSHSWRTSAKLMLRPS